MRKRRKKNDIAWNVTSRLTRANRNFWGAHASGLLVSAFRRNNLLKFVAAECGYQHAASMRSPELRLKTLR